MVSLLVTYIVALVITIAVIPLFFGNHSAVLMEIKKLNWASYALGLAIIGLEVGFLLAYRAGWLVSLAALYSNAIVVLLLIPVGILFFREKISFINAMGILFALAGVIMMSVRPTTTS